MTEPSTARATKTRARLHSALLTLLARKPLHAITVLELCQEAGINRTTFYNHYGCPQDLLEDIRRDLLDAITRMLDTADPACRSDVLQRVTLVFAYLEEHLSLARLLLNSSFDASFPERIFALPQIHHMLQAALAHIDSAALRAAMVDFAIHGSYKLLLTWLNQDERIPAAEEAALVLGLARRVCS